MATRSITLQGVLLPALAGGVLSLDTLRSMADTGKAYPLIEGTGRIYGVWVIESLSETRTIFFGDGAARRIEVHPFAQAHRRRPRRPARQRHQQRREHPEADSVSLVDLAETYLGSAARSYREASNYPRPICRVVVNGNDITAAVEQRLISIEAHRQPRHRGRSAGNHPQRPRRPARHSPRGASVQLWLGWSDTGLIEKGSYTVDEIEHSGAPDVINIRGRSVDLRGELKKKRERSWSATTLGAVVQAIASAHGLTAVISAALGAIELLHLDQANESDANLLARLGSEHDAIATVKAGRLLFMPTGKSTSASGLALPHVVLTRQDGDQHRYLEADRDAYTGVKAYYYELNSAEKKEAIAGGGRTSRNCGTPPTSKAPFAPRAPSGNACSAALPRCPTRSPGAGRSCYPTRRTPSPVSRRKSRPSSGWAATCGTRSLRRASPPASTWSRSCQMVTT